MLHKFNLVVNDAEATGNTNLTMEQDLSLERFTRHWHWNFASNAMDLQYESLMCARWKLSFIYIQTDRHVDFVVKFDQSICRHIVGRNEKLFYFTVVSNSLLDVECDAKSIYRISVTRI